VTPKGYSTKGATSGVTWRGGQKHESPGLIPLPIPVVCAENPSTLNLFTTLAMVLYPRPVVSARVRHDTLTLTPPVGMISARSAFRQLD
jgi:hypothetical protein